jgi:hypothetical protein
MFGVPEKNNAGRKIFDHAGGQREKVPTGTGGLTT